MCRVQRFTDFWFGFRLLRRALRAQGLGMLSLFSIRFKKFCVSGEGLRIWKLFGDFLSIQDLVHVGAVCFAPRGRPKLCMSPVS